MTYTDTITRSHTRSVYEGDCASDFMEWLNKTWNGLTDEERKSAKFETRPHSKMVMVGFKYETVVRTPQANGEASDG